jgi:hypothetical protein
VATLLPTGGVINPDGPATYGVIPGNGGAGTQPFTFTADPSLACGGSLVAALHLQDGALDLGNAATFNLGTKSIVLRKLRRGSGPGAADRLDCLGGQRAIDEQLAHRDDLA